METTKTTYGRRPPRRRGRSIIATLAAVVAMVGAVQAVTPASALAVRAECYSLYSWGQRELQRGNWDRGLEIMGMWEQCERNAEIGEEMFP